MHHGPPTNHHYAFTFYRDLTATEDSIKTALANVEKRELDIKNLQQEIDVLNKQKKSLHGDITVVQKDLQGKDESAVFKLV